MMASRVMGASMITASLGLYMVISLASDPGTGQRSLLSAHYARVLRKNEQKKPRSFDQGKIRDAFNHILGFKPRTLRFNYETGIIVSHF